MSPRALTDRFVLTHRHSSTRAHSQHSPPTQIVNDGRCHSLVHCNFVPHTHPACATVCALHPLRVAGTARGKSTHGRPHARTSANSLYACHRTDWLHCSFVAFTPCIFNSPLRLAALQLQTLPDPRHCHAALQPLNSSGNLLSCLAATPATIPSL